MAAHLKRGLAYRERGEPEAALRDLRRASELDPSAPRVFEWQGDVNAGPRPSRPGRRALRTEPAARRPAGRGVLQAGRRPVPRRPVGRRHRPAPAGPDPRPGVRRGAVPARDQPARRRPARRGAGGAERRGAAVAGAARGPRGARRRAAGPRRGRAGGRRAERAGGAGAGSGRARRRGRLGLRQGRPGRCGGARRWAAPPSAFPQSSAVFAALGSGLAARGRVRRHGGARQGAGRARPRRLARRCRSRDLHAARPRPPAGRRFSTAPNVTCAGPSNACRRRPRPTCTWPKCSSAASAGRRPATRWCSTRTLESGNAGGGRGRAAHRHAVDADRRSARRVLLVREGDCRGRRVDHAAAAPGRGRVRPRRHRPRPRAGRAGAGARPVARRSASAGRDARHAAARPRPVATAARLGAGHATWPGSAALPGARRPRRPISLASPWRVTPSSRAAAAGRCPHRASAAPTNAASNDRRAASSDSGGVERRRRPTWPATSPGRTRPRRGAYTAMPATAFCSSRALPGQSQARQGREQRGRQLGPCPGARGHRLPEVRGEHRDVLAPLAQRRHVQAHDVEPEAQVGAEAVGEHLAVQRPVAGRHQPHVDAPRRVLAEAAQLPFLQHAQQLGLAARRQLGDLVEEERAAVRFLEQPAPLDGRAGEGAAGVPEELGVDQLVGQCGAVERDKRPAAGADRVDGPGHQLLADAALAFDEDRERRRGDLRQGGRAAGPSPRSRRPGRRVAARSAAAATPPSTPRKGPSRSAASPITHRSPVEGGVAAGHQAISPISSAPKRIGTMPDGRRRRTGRLVGGGDQCPRRARPHRDRRGAHGLAQAAAQGRDGAALVLAMGHAAAACKPRTAAHLGAAGVPPGRRGAGGRAESSYTIHARCCGFSPPASRMAAVSWSSSMACPPVFPSISTGSRTPSAGARAATAAAGAWPSSPIPRSCSPASAAGAPPARRWRC